MIRMARSVSSAVLRLHAWSLGFGGLHVGPGALRERRRYRRGEILRANPRIDVTRPAGHVPHPGAALHCVA